MSMDKINKKFEELVTVVNMSIATRGSGGIGWFGSGITGARVNWMPDKHPFIWNEHGMFTREVNTLHVSKAQYEATPFVVGKTLVIRDGNEYRVRSVYDYRHVKTCKLVEVEVVRLIPIVD